jgi:hypothetical protein
VVWALAAWSGSFVADFATGSHELEVLAHVEALQPDLSQPPTSGRELDRPQAWVSPSLDQGQGPVGAGDHRSGEHHGGLSPTIEGWW